jgi:hypothetical protein
MENQWIKCSHQMPKQITTEPIEGNASDTVLCIDQYGETFTAWFDYDDFSWVTVPSSKDSDFKFIPAYWMAIPKHPLKDTIGNE